MSDDIKEVVSSCQECQHGFQHKASEFRDEVKDVWVGKRHNYRLFDEWSVDLVTELPATERGMKHLLVAVEAVSGFPEAFALKAKDSATIAGALIHLFCRYAAPRRLRSDRGGEFKKGVDVVCDEFGIIHSETSAYRPQSNGQVERRNADITHGIERVLTDDSNWDLALDNVLLGIRITPSRKTGLCPYEILFGEAPRLPMSFKFRCGESGLPINLERISHVDLGRFIDERAAEHRARWIRIRDKLRDYQDAQKPSKFYPGDLVMVRNFKRSKGEPRWEGPFVVIKETSKGVEIKTHLGQSRFLSLADLKRYGSPNVQLGEDSVETGTAPVFS